MTGDEGVPAGLPRSPFFDTTGGDPANLSPRRAALHRLADGMRGIVHRLVQTSAPLEMVEEAADVLELMAERFSAYPNASTYEGFAEAANAGGPAALFDHSPVQGRANPLAAPLKMAVDGDTVVGTATFGAAYEGPPGCVHGGMVAAAFDELLGATQSLAGHPGMTAHLGIDYRSPTPLHTELRFVGRIERVDGRKIYTRGQVFAGDELCAEADGLFISFDVARFAALKANRDERLRGRPDQPG